MSGGPTAEVAVEDPRITFIEPIQRFVMTYTAFSPQGPRIAVALSEDLFHWRRMNPSGHPEMAILHRPLFPGTRPEETACHPTVRELDLDRESIWISYRPMPMEDGGPYRLGNYTAHHRLATPVAPWERLKIGGGTPPVLTRHGWLIIYHGVSELAETSGARHPLCYSAGAMVLSEKRPRVIRYRSPEPVLKPELTAERNGTVANVVFPTGIDRRDDLG